MLASVFKTGMVKLPTRLGFNINPTISSLILVSKGARISRPKATIDGLESIIKNDQFKARIDKAIDDDNNPLGIAKLIGSDTLEDFARRLAALHRPIEFNWHAKFGLAKNPAAQLPAPSANSDTVMPSLGRKSKAVESVDTVAEEKPRQKLICNACGSSITYTVAKFCWFNKPKFGGNIFCMECQKKV